MLFRTAAEAILRSPGALLFQHGVILSSPEATFLHYEATLLQSGAMLLGLSDMHPLKAQSTIDGQEGVPWYTL